MTESRDGFQRTVMVHLSRCYPSTREWLVALPNRHEVVEQWERELADYSPAELVAAIDFIRLGGMAAPPNYDRECWPVYLRQACGRLRARTQQRELFEQGGGLEKQREKAREEHARGPTMREAMALVASGEKEVGELWQ